MSTSRNEENDVIDEQKCHIIIYAIINFILDTL